MGSVADPCDESLPKLSVVDAGFSIEDGIEEAVGDVGCELSRPDLLGDDTGGSLGWFLRTCSNNSSYIDFPLQEYLAMQSIHKVNSGVRTQVTDS